MVTVAELIDYLNQFKPDVEVVISLDDLGADASEERIDNAVSLTSFFEVAEDKR